VSNGLQEGQGRQGGSDGCAEWAQIVGIICSITMAVAALTFHVLNYRLNRQRVRAERGE